MKNNNLVNLAAIVLLTFSTTSCQEDRNISEDATANPLAYKQIKMKNLFGINAFEWDFLQDPGNPNDGSRIFEPKMALLRSFSSVRHYMDWEKIEDKQGVYSFNPTTRGGWNYDAVYSGAKTNGIEMITCMKNVPDWLFNTYPEKIRGVDNVPLRYGDNREDPKSYVIQATTAYQFVARYGSNKNIDTNKITLNRVPRWANDQINEVKVGLNLVKYIECNNEPDKWWQGKRAQQSAREYAANLSAFYDGHKGKLGKYAGVKAADSNIKVVIGGLARPDIAYVKEMVEWCKENRGFKSDGSIDICFDILNYHLYSNDNTGWFARFKTNKRGVAPELSNMGEIADSFVEYAENELGKNVEIWTTETGYDLNEQSVQRAIPIGQKSALITQADWILRTSLMYARHGVSRVFFYIAYDVEAPGLPNPGTFGSSGLLGQGARRPAADYLLQTSKLMGEYIYESTINNDPFVDVYRYKGNKMYVLGVPDEEDRTEDYDLNLGNAKRARIYRLRPGSDEMSHTEVPTENGKIHLTVTETPIFVQPI